MEADSVFIIAQANSSETRGISESLVAKAKQGDSAAFSRLYDLYFKKIYQFVFYRVSHKEIAEDLTEDVFIKAYSKLSGINSNTSFEGWLYQIARNRVIDYYRDKKQMVALDEIENTFSYEETVIDTLHLESRQKILLETLKKLKSDQQIVLKLKFFENLENEEIAEILGKTEGAIRVIQHRAMQKLKELLGNNNLLT